MARSLDSERSALSGVALGLAVLLACGTTLQAQTNSGSIRGFVYDETMAIIPGVSITAVDENRGVKRNSSASELGEFVFTLVDPGIYSLRFEVENFTPLTVEGLEVRVGETASISAQLAVAVAEDQVVVSAETARSTIEPQRVHQADHIDSVRIQNLPINRRDYLDLALLTPGVVDTNYVANATDRRIVPTPTSGLGIGGTNGRGNTFMIDGLDNVLNTGSVRASISQEAVHEFQVNRNSFSTEQGGAPGGAINIVTKGGTNELHGSLFGVVRNRRFQARNYFDPGKGAYTRAQSGASAGGPIERNKTFLYSAYERLDRHESIIVPLLSDRSFLTSLPSSQQQLINVLGAAGPPQFRPLINQLAGALVPANYPGIVSRFDRNSGVFPFSEERQQFLARVDHTVRDGHNLFFRGNATLRSNQNTSFGALTAFDRGHNSEAKDYSLVLGDTYVISPQWVSETRFGFGYHDEGSYPVDPHGPGIDINGFGNFGRDFILPARVVERVYQVRQNFMRISGRQTLKFGADVNPLRDWVRSETFMGGRFVFGEAVPLGSIIDNAAGPGTSQLLKGLLAQAGAGALAGAVDAPISSLQAFALGLPTIYQQGFGDPYWLGWTNRINFFVEDAIRVTPKFMLTLGIRHELELKTRFPRDYNNIGPRAGFAWSPDSKTVVRGGFGFFYARIDGQTVYVNDLLGDKQQIYQVFIPLTGLPGIQSTLSGQPLTSAEIFQTAQARGILGQRAIQRDDLAVHGIHPSPGYPLRVGFRLAEDTVNPYSQQGSLEVQREISGYALSVGYNYNRGIHIIRPLDLNVYQAGANEAGRPIVGFHNPLILQDNVYGSWARSYYHAMIAQLKKRFSRGFTVSAHHTWSKHIDENTDYNSSFEPHVQWDARGELALSHFHRKHRFVAHAVAQSPWKTTSGQGFGKNLLADFTLSGIMLARSGAPFNLNAGFDTIGDRHNDTHRPWGLGRNVGVGPSYLGLDMRLARTFTLSERMSVETIGEMFNILNKTNFRGVNGVVGNASLDDLPARLVGRRGPVTEPFSFASAFDPRQFQFTVRLSF
ncbi:MAG: carboxypeptidase regulatory-like domain-containing protein [Bryobacterales bacterium]|nr:carboxypeptidase regulatory-like domain-containing protein [Bryobacterales bacterium]